MPICHIFISDVFPLILLRLEFHKKLEPSYHQNNGYSLSRPLADQLATFVFVGSYSFVQVANSCSLVSFTLILMLVFLGRI